MNKIFQFLKSDIPTNDESSFRRAIIVKSALLVISLFLLFFIFFNFFITHREDIASLNLLSFSIFMLLYIYFNKTQNIKIVARLTTIFLIIFLLLFIYYAHSDHFSLIWTFFLPIYAIFANGKKEGLYFSLLFYLILFAMTFLAIGNWENGEWTSINWIRFSLSSSLILFTVYLNESAYEQYEKKLYLARKNEQKLIQKLSDLSLTDPLTQLYNRRYYDNIIDKMIANAKRENKCIHFFILDIDFFKNYNDYYGHEKGDQALISIARIVKENIQRESDFVFRLGGEEFAGIMISHDKESTQEWIKQLCFKVEDLKLEHKKSHCSEYTTVSIGISSKCVDEVFSAKDLYLEADKALYEAKLQGRNQTKVAS